MRIMVDIGHPAHVHFYKNFIWEMEKRGHSFLITARDKDVTVRLLKAYGFDFQVIGKIGRGKLNLIKEWIGRDWQIFKLARKFKPDVLTGISNPCAAHVARVTRAKSVIFNDSELGGLGNWVTNPFAHVICTPSCFTKDLGKKQIRYKGYHELAYLHPNYFTPDLSVLKACGLKEGERFFVVRFVAWGASHDIGQHGYDLESKRKLVAELSKYGRVLITSESPLPEEFDEYRINVPPDKIHHLLYYATLLIGDTQTMTTEAAVIGTPAIRCNSFVGPNDMGNFIELKNNYGLIYSFNNAEKAINKAIELIQEPGLKEEWQAKRDRLLEDKIDVTEFMVNFILQFINKSKGAG